LDAQVSLLLHVLLVPCRIVLENSGVAEPQNIRDQFNEAIASGHPLMQRVELDTLVTLVDSSSFIKDYSTK
jgi:G3E family GTPase